MAALRSEACLLTSQVVEVKRIENKRVWDAFWQYRKVVAQFSNASALRFYVESEAEFLVHPKTYEIFSAF